MEYGALVCNPFPDCESCIFSSKCVAFQNKEIDTIPVKSKKKKPKERFLNYIVFIDSKKKTIVNKRVNKDIWYKLNEFPLIESKKEIKKIGIIHDLQIIYSSQKKGLFNKLITFFIKRVEKSCFKTCDTLIFLSEEMKNAALDIYKISKIKCQVQFPFTTIKEKSLSNNLKDILPDKQFNIVYSGALG